MKTTLLPWLLILLAGCATYVDVKREQPVLYKVNAEHPGLGVLHVSVEDEVLARAPNDFSNMTGLVVKAAKDYAEQRGGFQVVDYTSLGFTAPWKRGYDRGNEAVFTLSSLEGVPAGTQTPVVLVVKVLDWRTFVETVDKTSKDVARVKLQLSTWTREGHQVHSEVVEALARAGDMQLHLKAGNAQLVHWYQKSDGRGPFFSQPGKRDQLFLNALREAVGVHLYPYFPHQVNERLVLIDDAPLKPGVEAAQAGRYDEALQKWEAIYQADPKAHGALYNAGLMHMVKGDDARALELLARAAQVEDKFLYRSMRDVVGDRLAMRKEIGAAGVTAVAPGS
ncbi:MAG: hypothetical protein ACOZIN_11875 [Myxococcota bacterium]